jgi:hypothetical protein
MSLVVCTRMMTLLKVLEGRENKIQELRATARRVHLAVSFESKALRIQPSRRLRQEEVSVLERWEASGWLASGRTNGSIDGPVNGRINA